MVPLKKRVLGLQGMRSLSGGSMRGCDSLFWGSLSRVAIAFRGAELERVDRLFGKLEGVRSLFGKFEGCDSEARPRNRCLGSWRGAIAVWEVEGVRSLFREVGGV
ncbi:MAG: hypothetical protein PT120_11815 [Aphanizomenon gracile PMC649.10]|nr:hypothetical protein [Aphanizomenon gracile PMC649.10]